MKFYICSTFGQVKTVEGLEHERLIDVLSANGIESNLVSQITILFKGRVLDGDFSLSYHGIEDGSKIFVVYVRKSRKMRLETKNHKKYRKSFDELITEEMSMITDRLFITWEMAKNRNHVFQEYLNDYDMINANYNTTKNMETNINFEKTINCDPLPLLFNMSERGSSEKGVNNDSSRVSSIESSKIEYLL